MRKMAQKESRTKAGPIGEDDLTKYLDEYSDFAFELKTLEKLNAHGFNCEHSGTYDDPITKVPREFDLRATRTIDRFRVRLAVECKNLKADFPLLILCVPRRPEEAFHEFVHSFGSNTFAAAARILVGWVPGDSRVAAARLNGQAWAPSGQTAGRQSQSL